MSRRKCFTMYENVWKRLTMWQCTGKRSEPHCRSHRQTRSSSWTERTSFDSVKSTLTPLTAKVLSEMCAMHNTAADLLSLFEDFRRSTLPIRGSSTILATTSFLINFLFGYSWTATWFEQKWQCRDSSCCHLYESPRWNHSTWSCGSALIFDFLSMPLKLHEATVQSVTTTQ